MKSHMEMITAIFGAPLGNPRLSNHQMNQETNERQCMFTCAKLHELNNTVYSSLELQRKQQYFWLIKQARTVSGHVSLLDSFQVIMEHRTD